MDFQKLADLYEELENTSSGNAMREILSKFFKEVPPEDIAMVAYLTLGQIDSEYEGLVLGMAEKSVLKAISTAGGIEQSKVKTIMEKEGDVGLTAEIVLKKKPQTLVPLGKLTVPELFEKLHKITKLTGSGSQEAKTNTLASMLQKSSAKGARYIARITLGTLRMGVGDMTVLDSLAIAFTDDKKNKEILEKAYNICPDVGVIAETLAKKGIKGIEKIDISVGRPIKMMLAQRVKELKDIKEKIPGEMAVEGKYDGERVQAHKSKGKITLFSRRLDNITAQFPDVVKYLEKNIEAKDFVVEGEIIAVDEEGRPLHFQKLMQRKRKTDIEEYVKKVPVQVKLFDLLYYNSRSFLHEPYSKRTEKLQKIVKKNQHIMTADRLDTDDLSELNKFFKEMLHEKYEGVIVKGMDSEYQAGTRGWNWIKWKKEYVKEMIDTFDLVVVGAFYGKGKRKGTYGALLCAGYNEKDDTFETVCKLGTGLTDEALAELPEKFEKYKLEKKPARLTIKKEMEPDVWLSPHFVVEVLAAEITESPYHSLGLALRFPRFIRFREKKPEQATTTKEIKEMR
ncbi:MAG: ATP-dependent DNA ligase [Nanoarchaeota archaeon]|nr:ATP-dependent DNA ligase [Nanoarchaeota archaeon]MBU1643830.1 ATP-dependent DNA ligase [Nanoarchaeota archaeon]MBU1976682.1 ATP-dependent DNA ligase [Nanoarchaeota archaeon]